MKLVIQIPCFNEEETLPLVFEKMPRAIEGIDELEFQIIDDSSTDRTVEVANELGIHHVIRIPGQNKRWLGRAFRLGMDEALRRGADIIVNTDGDNQYPSEKIPELIQAIISQQADIVIGNRNPSKWKEFGIFKRFLQWFGNQVASLAAGEKVYDAVSGFRAYSRRAALAIHVTTNYTYTVDTLIQAYKKGLAIEWIDITPNAKTRESRLIKSLWSKVRKSGITIVRVAVVYAPFKMFAALALLFFLPGGFFTTRFFYYYFFVPAEGAGHMQSVILGASCLVIAVQMLVLGILAELMATNRQIVEQVSSHVRKIEIMINRRYRKRIEQ